MKISTLKNGPFLLCNYCFHDGVVTVNHTNIGKTLEHLIQKPDSALDENDDRYLRCFFRDYRV